MADGRKKEVVNSAAGVDDSYLFSVHFNVDTKTKRVINLLKLCRDFSLKDFLQPIVEEALKKELDRRKKEIDEIISL